MEKSDVLQHLNGMFKIIPEDEPKVTQGVSIWSLTLPKGATPELFQLAKNRIEMFCEEYGLVEVGGSVTKTGINITIPDFLASDLVSYVRISGATLQKLGLSRNAKRLGKKHGLKTT